MNFNLGPRWQRFIEGEIASGRYLNQSEVVRDALRALEQKRLHEFNAVFASTYPGSPAGEPTEKDEAEISAAVKAVRQRRKKARSKAA